jgi:hypothetical protein
MAKHKKGKKHKKGLMSHIAAFKKERKGGKKHRKGGKKSHKK